MEEVEGATLCVHDGSIGFTVDGSRFVNLADLSKTKHVVDNDIVAELP